MTQTFRTTLNVAAVEGRCFAELAAFLVQIVLTMQQLYLTTSLCLGLEIWIQERKMASHFGQQKLLAWFILEFRRAALDRWRDIFSILIQFDDDQDVEHDGPFSSRTGQPVSQPLPTETASWGLRGSLYSWELRDWRRRLRWSVSINQPANQTTF